MKPLSSMTLILFACAMLSGCAGIQDEYKPLYQVKPEKEQLK